jgi:hypothetical protein
MGLAEGLRKTLTLPRLGVYVVLGSFARNALVEEGCRNRCFEFQLIMGLVRG